MIFSDESLVDEAVGWSRAFGGHVSCFRRSISVLVLALIAPAVSATPILTPVAGGSTHVVMQPQYLDDPGRGFEHPALGAQRRSAFEYALGIWSSQLQARYHGESIVVSARFDNLGGDATSATVAEAAPFDSASAFFADDPFPMGTIYPRSLLNHRAGEDTNESLFVDFPEISVVFNDTVDGPVLGKRDFYYGTDENSGADIDFVTVALHEVAHGLGFDSETRSDGTWPLGNPSVWDRRLVDGEGALFTDQDAPGRAAALTSGDLFFAGPRANRVNGGSIRLFAPGIFTPGSSVTHLDPTVYSGELMSPFYSGANHTPGHLTLAILDDLGWSVVPEPTTLVLFAGGLTGLVRRRRAAG